MIVRVNQTIITSRHNPKVKYLHSLKDKKLREQDQCFLVEGFREISRALQMQKNVKEIYLCPEYAKAESIFHLESLALKLNTPIHYVSKSVFEKISYRESPDGCLSIVSTWNTALSTIAVNTHPLLVVAQSIEKPGNLGALIRSCEGAGAHALLICDPVIDIFNPNVIRASQGALFSIPIGIASSMEILEFFKRNQIQSIATSPDAQKTYWEISYKEPTAILVGSESHGLDAFWLKNNTHKVKIPMHNLGDSLNVHTAAVLTLYEGLRQRQLV